MRISIHTYSARGHASGYGGDGADRRGASHSNIRVPLAKEDERDIFQTARSRFVDEVLETIRKRNQPKVTELPETKHWQNGARQIRRGMETAA
jgi:hypothetical protein